MSQGLEQAPDSGTGQLLSAYLHLVARDMGAARTAFQRVLEQDRYHPRAMLGLARITFEAGELDQARALLDRALAYYQDFPDARALRDLLDTWTPPTPLVAAAASSPADRLVLPEGARDMVLARADGSLLLARTEASQQRPLALHVVQVSRIAAAALSRSGLGSLRHALIDTDGGLTVLRSEGGHVLCLTLPRDVGPDGSIVEVERLWADLGLRG